QINGRVFKATAKNAQALFLEDVVELVAHTRKGHFNRAVGIACPALNLATATLPVTLSSCNGNYQETKVSLHPSVKASATGDGLEISAEPFDGRGIRGPFRGALKPPGQPDGPAAVRNGKFNLALGTS